jgi:hypothetical protein
MCKLVKRVSELFVLGKVEVELLAMEKRKLYGFPGMRKALIYDDSSVKSFFSVCL